MDHITLLDNGMMEVRFTIPQTMIANVRGQAVPRDMTVLPVVAFEHQFAYGFQRTNNDAGAISRIEGETDEEFDARAAMESIAKANKKWDAQVAGTIRVQTSRVGDPVMQRAIELAVAKVEAAIRAKHGGKKPEEYTAKLVREKAKSDVDANPKLLDEARSQIEAEKGLDVEIEL